MTDLTLCLSRTSSLSGWRMLGLCARGASCKTCLTSSGLGGADVRPNNPIPMLLFQAGMNRTEVRAATGFAPSMVDRYYRKFLAWRDAQRLAASPQIPRCNSQD